MAYALEVRNPFMDPELVGIANQLDQQQLIAKGGKSILRQLFADDLPASVFHRPKRGFALPIGDWLRGPMRDMLDSALADCGLIDQRVARVLVDQHHSQSSDHTHRLFALLVLGVFCGRRQALSQA